eukprot:TRINITY_DN13376_c0_g1_i1.p1 TRINITY_DN13376_c0_g1~~TRINITY_DN13376_c0_g1_i1.p1  ORF type:complete len:106 (+),score=5.79 TRINITY_DN13376_c0_g1_i1:145-462(+)
MIISKPHRIDPNQALINKKEDYLELKRKIYKAGSTKSGKFKFNRNERFYYFVSSQNSAKSRLRNYLDPDILGLKQPAWDASVSLKRTKRFDHQRQLFYVAFPLTN